MTAVRSSTASDSRPSSRPPAATRWRPERTCIGCRRRAPAAELLRTVAAPEPAGTGGSRPVPVVPDPRSRAAGRGAWVHPDPACVDLAERRRAYARALRAPGPVDPSAVRVYVAETVRTTSRPKTGGTPQE